MKKFSLVLLLLLLIPTVVFGATLNININRTRELEDIYHPIIVEVCDVYQTDVNLIKAIIRVESVYDKQNFRILSAVIFGCIHFDICVDAYKFLYHIRDIEEW